MEGPFLLVLGIAQDGGAPQAGTGVHPGGPGFRRHAACLAIVDPRDGRRWLLDCTPDFREQLAVLDAAAPRRGPALDGVFLTHAHIGHYTGLMHLGREAIGAEGVPVHAMPRMADFLRNNGPWDQLVRFENIEIREMAAAEPVALTPDLSVTPVPVPHRQEYSETVGFHVRGPGGSALFIPDIDSWEEWDAEGTRIEEWLDCVDVAYLDGSFHDDGELAGRDMAEIPHPRILASMDRFASLDEAIRAKVRFIHLNHTNPALLPGSDASREVEAMGFGLAAEGERFNLNGEK